MLDEVPPPRLTTRLARYLIPSAIVLILCLGSGGFWVIWNVLNKSEDKLAKEASEYYDQGSFDNAHKSFQTLEKNFPNSERAKEYSFMVEWCGACAHAKDPDDLADAAAQLEQFIKSHKKDELMVQKARDAGQRLLHLVKTLAERYANPTDETPLAAADRIEQLRRTVIALGRDALKPNEPRQIDDEIGKVRKAVERWRKRRDTLAAIHLRDGENPMDAIKRARSLLARMERELPGIGEEAKPALDELEKLHLGSVVFQPAKDVPAPPPPPAEEEGEVLLFAPLVKTFAPNNVPPANDPIVPALARGVLYALKAANGELVWETHVGIDTTELPERVAATAFTPELLLVLSADAQTLSALNVDGDSLWEYRVGQPVLGKPIIIDQRAYLADYSGWVHEIELSRGQLLGRWFVGQPLTCGGAREKGTSRIYFPADDSCIYVLDVKARRCVAILYDGHPSGSLRSGPVIVPPEGNGAPGYLILNQASGLDAMQLRVFELPLQDPHAQPLPLSAQASLAGWTWFEPKEDGEKLAVLSDAGILGLFGIRQLGNNDAPLFPLLRSGELDLSPFLRTPASPTKRRELVRERGRSLVVHMQGDDLWVLAHGRFQQLHLGLPPQGPQAVPGWKEPLDLGSPLHEPQRSEERNGQSTFFLVTQALNQQTCLATAVDEAGKILWQRQLGSVCQGQPLALTPPGGGPPVLVMLDQGGGLFELDPQQSIKKLRVCLQALAPPLAENPRVPPQLLPAADGHSAYEVAFPGDGETLVVRHIEFGAGSRTLHYDERIASQKPDKSGVPTLVGRPAVMGSLLLLPMSDGKVRWMSLTDDKSMLEAGQTWRTAQAPVAAPTILPFGSRGDDRLLITDGSRQLTVYEWLMGKDFWEKLPKEGEGEENKPLEFLMAAPPVLLPAENNPRIVVADSAGVLRLFTVTPVGALQPGQTWPLEGNLTAGPFVQATPEGWRIGCVLDRRRLLWIDPAKAQPLWTYDTDGPALLGLPQRIEDMLVVALQSGRYVGIDPKTGKPKGAGYSLRTSAAPAATPMAFGPGRMFAPLSDGTALLLSLELLKKN